MWSQSSRFNVKVMQHVIVADWHLAASKHKTKFHSLCTVLYNSTTTNVQPNSMAKQKHTHCDLQCASNWLKQHSKQKVSTTTYQDTKHTNNCPDLFLHALYAIMCTTSVKHPVLHPVTLMSMAPEDGERMVM
jgi:microcystin-dependent protein